MRIFAFVVALLVAASSFADRLLLIPTGKKLLHNVYRFELLTEPSRDRTFGWIGTGLGQSFDFELTGESLDDDSVSVSLDFSYNYLTPITDFVPGVSLGVQDAAGRTQRGRAFYLAVTYRLGNFDEHNQDIPTEVTFGFWDRREGLMFAGAVLPFSEHLKLLVEHDSHEFTAGFQISPIKGADFRFMFRANEVLLGMRIQKRF